MENSEEESEEQSSLEEPRTPRSWPSSSQQALLLDPLYARSKSVIHDELRSFRVFLRCCFLDHSSPPARAASYAAFLSLSLAVPAAVSASLRADPALSPASASAVTFNRLATLTSSALAAVSFLTLASFFRRGAGNGASGGGLRGLLFLDGGLRDDAASVRRGYERELDRAFRILALILLPALCVEAGHKAVFFFSTVRLEPPLPPPRATTPLSSSSFLHQVPWRAVALVLTVASWVYRTGVFLLVCVLFRLTCELQILRFEGIYHMFDVEQAPRAGADEIFAEHRRIRTQLLATSHRYRVFILCCLVTITVSQLGALLVALSSKDRKSFANSGDLLVCYARVALHPSSGSSFYSADVKFLTEGTSLHWTAGWVFGAAEWLLHVPVRRGEDHAPGAKDRVHRQPVAHGHGAPRQAGAGAGGQHVGERRRGGIRRLLRVQEQTGSG